MKKINFIISIIILISVSFFSPLNVQNKAQGATAGCVGGVPDSNCDETAGETIFNCTDDCLDPGIPRVPFETILERLIEWTLGFGLAIAVTFLIWSGIVYTSSSGDAQKAENAKKVMKYAILGVLVIGISYAIITVLDTIFT